LGGNCKTLFVSLHMGSVFMFKRTKIYLNCIIKTDDLISFVDMNNKLYFYSNTTSPFIFKTGEFYEVSARLKYITPETIYLNDLRMYNTDSLLIQRMFKIKTILDD
jgi:hypothetical protein